MTPEQTDRHRALMDDHAAVAAIPLGTGDALLVARGIDGDARLVEVLDERGQTVRGERALSALGLL